MEDLPSKEPPIVLPPLAPMRERPPNRPRPFHDAGDWLDRMLGSEAYGAPRVFDLFTLLAITLAFALMFAMLRLVQPLLLGELETTAVVIGVFVTGIAIFQLALWQGKKPRIASVVGGPILWFILFAGFNWQPGRGGWDWVSIVLGLFSSIFGIPAGYLGGAMVAGVFLIADVLRSRFLRHPPAEFDQNDDQVFAPDPAEPPSQTASRQPGAQSPNSFHADNEQSV